MKKIMILGAGIYQVPLIQKAKEMGLKTLVVSIPGPYPGISLADEFFPFDTRDYEGILKCAKEQGISGICTSGTDVAVRAIGYVNEHLNLKGISYDAACRVTDKMLMKEAFAEHGVSTARFIKVMSLTEALDAADAIGYPVILKIVDSSGSRGVIKAENAQELTDAYEEASRITRKEYLLIEEFIQADEIGVDAFVGEHGMEVFLPHEKFTYTSDGVTVPLGHAFPYKGSEELLKELKLQLEKAAEAVGLKNCPINADVFVKGNKVWIIEIGGRTGATCIPELISIYKGYDWYEKIICAAMGEAADFTSEQENSCMAKLLFSDVTGRIEEIDETVLKELEKEGAAVQLDYGIGAQIDKMRNATDRIGHVILACEKEQEIDRCIQKIKEGIRIS